MWSWSLSGTPRQDHPGPGPTSVVDHLGTASTGSHSPIHVSGCDGVSSQTVQGVDEKERGVARMESATLLALLAAATFTTVAVTGPTRQHPTTIATGS